MKPNVDLVASARRVASAFGLLGLMVSPALAGDRALIDFIGFSPDAKYFAFEEFGIQDGSGAAYSNIYVIDLENDSWLDGTPIRAQAPEGDDSENLLAIRSKANTEALKFIADNKIFVPAEIAALNGDGVIDEDPMRLAFMFPIPVMGQETASYQLEISTFTAKSPEDCADYFGNDPFGFELTVFDGSETRVLHRDEDTLPASRSCPYTYRPYAVLVPGLGGTPSAGVVIVSYTRGGFEGPDRRFLAVPLAF
jgi:predicted secreted protein